jgi:hypothetical protein
MNTASNIIFEERNTNVGLGEVIRFRLPPDLKIINTQETYLKFNMVVGSQALTRKQSGFAVGNRADVEYQMAWVCDHASNLIKNLTLKDGSSGTIIEQITDYNRLHQVLRPFIQNTSMKNLDKLYCGSDTQKVVLKNKLTTRTIDGAGASTEGETQQNNEVEVLLALDLSGLLNNAQPLPVMMFPNGIEVEILLEEDAYKVIHAQSDQSGPEATNYADQKGLQNVNAGYRTGFKYATDGLQNGVVDFILVKKITNARNDNAFTGDVSATTTADHPFYNGQTLTFEASTGDVDAIINNIELDGASNQLKIDIVNTSFAGNTTTDMPVYIKNSDLTKPQITLSELQMVVGTIDPTPQQMSQLEGSMKGGYSYPYKTYNDFPVNQNSGALQVSNLINCRYRMAKSIISFWEDVGSSTDIDKVNLLPVLNSSVVPSSYQYKIQGLLVPQREVDLTAINRNRTQTSAWNCVRIKELEQALQACGFAVRSLEDQDGVAVFGRALVPAGSGFTHDLSNDSETRLLIKYTTQNASLLQHNFICSNKSLVISGNGVEVVE